MKYQVSVSASVVNTTQGPGSSITGNITSEEAERRIFKALRRVRSVFESDGEEKEVVKTPVTPTATLNHHYRIPRRPAGRRGPHNRSQSS